MAAVDLDHLNRYTGGERGLNEEILRLFDMQCREMLEELRLMAEGEPKAKRWKEITHTLKGAARGIGALALADAAAEAEPFGENVLAGRQAAQAIFQKSLLVQQFIEEFLRGAL